MAEQIKVGANVGLEAVATPELEIAELKEKIYSSKNLFQELDGYLESFWKDIKNRLEEELPEETQKYQKALETADEHTKNLEEELEEMQKDIDEEEERSNALEADLIHVLRDILARTPDVKIRSVLSELASILERHGLGDEMDLRRLADMAYMALR